MKNILFLFETLASLSVAFFFWGFLLLGCVKRKTWIRFFFGFALSLVVLFSFKAANGNSENLAIEVQK
jgi:hypothetical protein